MTAIHIRLPPLIEQLRSASGEDAQLSALNALRQALEPSNGDGGSCPDGFVATWLPSVLQQLQANVSPDVRRCLAAFTGQLVVHHTGVQGIVHCTACLASLLRDNAPGVVKEAVLAFACLLRASLALVSLKPSQPDVRDMWDNVRRLQANMCLVSQAHPSTCVKVAAAKLAEHVVLLFTGDSAPSVSGVPETLVNKLRLPDAARLAADADPQLRWLLEPLRPAAALEQPPARLIAHISAAWSITIARPNLMGKLLPSLMALAKEGGFLASNSPAAANCTGADVSVGNALRGGLAAVLKSRVPSSVPWRDRIVAALGALGAQDTATNMIKYIERQEYKERRVLREKRPAESPLAGQDAKKPTGAAAPAAPAAPAPAGASSAARTQQPPRPSVPPAVGQYVVAPGSAPPYILQAGPNGVVGMVGPYGGGQPVQPPQPGIVGGGMPAAVQQYGLTVVQGPMGQQMLVQVQQPQSQPQPQPQPQPAAPQPQPQPPQQPQHQQPQPAMDAHQLQLQHQAAMQAAAIVTAAAQIAAGLPPVSAPLSDQADLDQMLQYVDAAVRSKDEALLESLLTGLVHGQPVLLADLVLAHIHLLPPALPQHLWPPPAPAAAPEPMPAPAAPTPYQPPQYFAPGQQQLPPPQAAAAARVSPPGRTPTPPPAMGTAPQAPPPRPPEAAAAAPRPARRSRGPLPPLTGPARPREMDPLQLAPPAGKVTGALQVTGAFGAGVGAGAAAAPLQPPPLRPAALTPAQATAMRQSALKRLMAIPPCAAPGRLMRQVVLARFGARVPPGDATAEQLLLHLLRHYHDGGCELALLWLNALFVQACPLSQPARPGAAAAAAGRGGGAQDVAMQDAEGKEAEEGKAQGGDVKEGGGGGGQEDSKRADAAEGEERRQKQQPQQQQPGDVAMADAGAEAGAEGGSPGRGAAAEAESAAAAGASTSGGSNHEGAGGGGGVAAATPPDFSGTTYETVLLALLERARQHAVTWHAAQLRRYSRGLREAAAALQQQRALLQPLQPAARLGAGLEGLLATARQLQANVAWAAAQGTWLQGESAAMDLGPDGDGEGGEGGEGEELRAVPELADEVAAEVEGVQASVQESMMQLRQWQLEVGQPLPAGPPPAQPPRPVVGLEIKELLKAAPSLPLAGVLGYLRDLLAAGGKWPTLALSCAWDAIESRPPVRGAMLELVLEAAEDPHEEIRSAAVRLLTSKLYPRPHLRPTIIATAALRLSALMPAAPAPAPPEVTADAAAAAEAGSGEAAAAAVAPPAPAPPPEPSVVDCTRRCALYVALVAKQPDLLPGLVVTYAGGGPHLRAAIGGHAGPLALALGPSHPALLAQLRAPVPGSEDLLLVMLHALTEKDLPPGRLVDACKAWYAASSDPRVMVPVAFTLSRRDVIALLPVMLRSLQPPGLKKLYRSLASKHGEVEPLFSASELLLVLHRDMDPMRDGVPLKSLMSAVDLALHSPDIFPQPVMLSAIRIMEGLVPLPRMFMRTVIQALKAAPRLRTEVAQLLERLVAKQIWTDRDQWRGFLLCADHMRSDAYTPLLQLPEAVMEVTLLGPAASEAARAQAGRMGLAFAPGCQLPLASGARLAAYVLTPAPNQPPLANVLVTHQMRNILQRLIQIHLAQEAAAAAAAANAAAATAVKTLKPEAGPEAALGPYGAVKTEAATGLKAEAAPPGDAPGPARGATASSAPAVAAGSGPSAQWGAGVPPFPAAGPEGSGRGPALTIRAGREAAAAAAGMGQGAALPAIKSERDGGAAAAPGPVPGAGTGAGAGAADQAARPNGGGEQEGLAAGAGMRAGVGMGTTSADATMEEEPGTEECGAGGGGGGAGGGGSVGAEMEAVEGGAGGGTCEFELDFEDDL